MRCPGCSEEVQPTVYGRCPLCGAVAQAGAAQAADGGARQRASWRRALGPPPDEGTDSGCGTCALLLLGLPALVLFLGLFSVGQRNRWTSDGPGMLIIMIGVALTGFVAVSALGGALLGRTRLGRWISWFDD